MSRVPVSASGEQTSLWERKRRAGQRLICGFEGSSPSEPLREALRLFSPAGFILFARNVEEPAQVRELNRELAGLVPDDLPALLSVDQEGGRVQRVKSPATEWPPMRCLGRARDLRLTRDVAAALAREVRALGFNLDFAPVADVDSNPQNPVIGDRSFGRSAPEVALQVASFIAGMQGEGLIACAKHFPGHGDTSTDSHLSLPVVEKELPDLEGVELPPFQAAVEAGVGSVMTAHVVFPALDEERPATLSSKVLRPLLRERLGFNGIVFSDDMEMKAVHGRYGLTQQLDWGVRAGVDIFLCCKETELQVQAFETLVRLQEEDPGFERLLEASDTRLLRLRERFFLGATEAPSLDVLGTMAHRVLAERVRAIESTS